MLGVALLRITLLGVALLGITLLRGIALLLRVALLGITLLGIALLWVSLLRITLLRVLALGILPLYTRHIALLWIALLAWLHGLLPAQFVHHLPNYATQHAAAHRSCHRVDTWLTGIAWLIALLGIVLLAVLLLHGVGYCGLFGRINDVLE